MIIFGVKYSAMEIAANKISLIDKLKAYLVFTKFRLSALVIVSALSGFLFAGGSDGYQMTLLLIGGLLVTAASNGSNQIWERDLDKLMKRTERRPIPMQHMSVSEGVIVVGICLLIGTYMLYQINMYSAVLGVLAFVMYVFLYTPLKRITPWAVFVGAFPGAIPPMLGAIAATGEFGLVPGRFILCTVHLAIPSFLGNCLGFIR
jgi:protoheme IX farnesyltransferase